MRNQISGQGRERERERDRNPVFMGFCKSTDICVKLAVFFSCKFIIQSYMKF